MSTERTTMQVTNVFHFYIQHRMSPIAHSEDIHYVGSCDIAETFITLVVVT